MTTRSNICCSKGVPMRLHGSRRTFAWSSMVGAAVLVLGCLSLVAQSPQPSSTAKPRPPQAAPRPAAAPAARPIRVLFVGADEESPHNPAKMFPLLAAPLARRGIQLTYGRTASSRSIRPSWSTTTR
jgi:hypothetical protein